MMNILLIWSIRIGSVFLTPLLIAMCFELHTPLPLGILIGCGFLIAWKIDRDDQRRMLIRYKIKQVVKD